VSLNKPDDFLFVKTNSAFDAVFVIDDALLVGGKESNHIAPETFITIKRFAIRDLAGMEVKESNPPADPSVGTLRHPVMATRLKEAPPAQAAPTAAVNPPADSNPSNTAPAPTVSAAPGTPEAPGTVQKLPGKDIAPSIKASFESGPIASSGIHGIGVGTTDATATDAPVAGGLVTFGRSPGAITAAKIDPTATLAKLAEGSATLTQFFCPPERTIVQITLHPYTPGWDWMAQIGTTKLVDSQRQQNFTQRLLRTGQGG